jgi:hypothetical protein
VEVSWHREARWGAIVKKDVCLMSTGDGPPELQRTSPFRQLIRRIWPWAMIALGVAITVVWIFFLAYGLAKIIEMAI